MYKTFTYLEVAYFLPIYLYMIFIWFTKLVTKMKPIVSSIEVHPQLSNNEHLMDGVPMVVGSLWLKTWHDKLFLIITHKGVWVYV